MLFQNKLLKRKSYKLNTFFTKIGRFPDALGRRHFIFALLDKRAFERKCPYCNEMYLDVLQHILRNCQKTAYLRLRLKHTLVLYNCPSTVDISNKMQLFTLAIQGKKVFLRVLCEHLKTIGDY